MRDIGQVGNAVGDNQKYLTFIYVFGGCHTTSAIFQQGKYSILRLLSSKSKKRSLAAWEAADVFSDSNVTPEQTGKKTDNRSKYI